MLNSCFRCPELEAENKILKETSQKASDALRIAAWRPHSYTDMILGAALSGGDYLSLARDLARLESERKAS